MVNRRTLLASLGAVGSTVAIAGCNDILGSGPEDAVEQFFAAASDGDTDAMNEVLHPESSGYPIEDDDAFPEDTTVNETEERSTEEFVRWQFEQSNQEVDEEDVQSRIEQAESQFESILEEVGADDFTWVYTSLSLDGEDEEVHLPVIEDDGEWLVYL